MSIAQQPRRVGGVNLRPTAAHEIASKYDSQEVPVLIRLPARSSVSTTPVGHLEGKTYGHDSARPKSERKRKETKSTRGHRPANKSDRGVNTKVVIGGMLVGVVIAGLLFFTNGGSTEQPEDVAWPDENGEALVASGEPQVIIPDFSEASPEFAYGDETVEALPLAADTIDTMTAPDLADVPNAAGIPRDALAGESSGTTSPISWNQEPSTRLYPNGGANSTTKRAENWPGGDFNDTASGTDYRSSMNGTDTGVYHTGRLDQKTSPSESILDGTIEIPTQTSVRR